MENNQTTEWIHVSDSLPEYYLPVLYLADGINNYSCYVGSRTDPRDTTELSYESKKRLEENDGFTFKAIYWRPIPNDFPPYPYKSKR